MPSMGQADTFNFPLILSIVCAKRLVIFVAEMLFFRFLGICEKFCNVLGCSASYIVEANWYK
jgi:hypothetical protein